MPICPTCNKQFQKYGSWVAGDICNGCFWNEKRKKYGTVDEDDDIATNETDECKLEEGLEWA